MTQLTFALATEDDIDAIHRLELEIFAMPWRREFFVTEVRGSGRFNLVVRRGDAIAGYLFAMWFLDEMHVMKIAVAADERRRGIARQLMDRAEEFAAGRGITMISLEVRQSNVEAQAFYTSIGFDAAYRRPRYYPDGESAVVMIKRLAARA
jgi:ribosomal-protein-alanine N-acetyltransferase